MRKGFNHHQVILKIKRKIEDHYSDKFTYAMPDWAMLSAEPEIISILDIHSEEVVKIAKQKVDFLVDFNTISSVVNYVDFLSNQMNSQKEITGYVIFYNKNTLLIKDPNYLQDLTAFQESELNKYNQTQSQIDISLLITDQNWNEVDLLGDLLR